jgi:hypothetical protein
MICAWSALKNLFATSS